MPYSSTANEFESIQNHVNEDEPEKTRDYAVCDDWLELQKNLSGIP